MKSSSKWPNASDILVKSSMSELRIVTSRSSIWMFCPCTRLSTTGSGTNRAKACMPRVRLQNACCKLITSLMRHTFSLLGCVKSRLLRRCVRSVSSSRRLETRRPRQVPRQALSSSTARATHRDLRRALVTFSAECLSIHCTWSVAFLATSDDFCAKEAAGSTSTTSHAVSSSRRTEMVPTCQHSHPCVSWLNSLSQYAPGSKISSTLSGLNVKFW
mmetsp:Transcript_21914/g.58655  ORF Transcript_21914/g.58655 Transcript_21914/m.58655 type:complete len:216 (+) Transcript_21914:1459-2106(+)